MLSVSTSASASYAPRWARPSLRPVFLPQEPPSAAPRDAAGSERFLVLFASYFRGYGVLGRRFTSGPKHLPTCVPVETWPVNLESEAVGFSPPPLRIVSEESQHFYPSSGSSGSHTPLSYQEFLKLEDVALFSFVLKKSWPPSPKAGRVPRSSVPQWF